MGDLIARKTAIEAVKNYCKDAIDAGREILDTMDDIVEMVRVIDALPVVDAVPVVHSKWKLVGADKRGRGGIFVCLACDKCYPFTCDYCPNCGAKMDLEAKNEY